MLKSPVLWTHNYEIAAHQDPEMFGELQVMLTHPHPCLGACRSYFRYYNDWTWGLQAAVTEIIQWVSIINVATPSVPVTVAVMGVVSTCPSLVTHKCLRSSSTSVCGWAELRRDLEDTVELIGLIDKQCVYPFIEVTAILLKIFQVHLSFTTMF